MSNENTIFANPTKAFFVRMLTRDIELSDAILDLLDNCVDGIVRQQKKTKSSAKTSKTPYEGFWAKISAGPDGFEILDNCGGIPENIAKHSAFMMGRPDSERDSDIETVGMYGIGMKRAIFKMGESCVVTSQPNSPQYEVQISPTWMQADDEWTLTLKRTGKTFKENGTKIVVQKLHPSVKRQFTSPKSTFLADLEKEIAQHYAVILQKGLNVTLNGKKLKGVELSVLSPKSLGASKKAKIEPYLFIGDFHDVHVEVAVGFYRPLVKEQELEESLLKSTRDHAGWTVVCNERVVLYNDKSAQTGWGTRGVPSFHNQFISIAGIVTFRSNKSMQLPLTTTKRGLDSSSEVYHIVLDFMQDGMKKFTSFTNHWKKMEEQTEAAFDELIPQDPSDVLAGIDKSKLSPIRRHKDKGSGGVYLPDLPLPSKTERVPRICFNATQAEIDAVKYYYYGDQEVDGSDLGRACFDESLELAKDAE